MHIDYAKLAEQYGGFLIAIGGVSITVLTLVLSAWRIQPDEPTPSNTPGVSGKVGSNGKVAIANNRPALVISLFIATLCCFVGSHLMAETAAFIAGLRDTTPGIGVTQFFLASVNIYIGVTVVVFAIVFLAGEYRNENQHVRGVNKMSLVVFSVVVLGVLGWMIRSVMVRVPAPWSTSLSPLILVAGLVAFFFYRLRTDKARLKDIVLPITFIVIVLCTGLSLFVFPYILKPSLAAAEPAGYVLNWTVRFFVFAITASCFALTFSAFFCTGRKDAGCLLWPPKKEKTAPLDAEKFPRPAPSEAATNLGLSKSREDQKPAKLFQPRVPKILILSSDTGGGHRSAAAAIVAGVQKFFAGQSYAVRVVKAVEESHSITAKMVGIYNWVLRNKQHWMKYVYWAMNRFRPETRAFFHRRCVGYVNELFERWCPHIVVSVHPLTQHMFGRVLRELKLADRIPLVSVVTDPYYGFWKGWACDDVTLYLVASNEARQQLIDYGVAPERIKISGMPVHHKFAYPGEEAAQAARRALGLDPEKFTVFVNAGWEGGGNIPQIFRELVRGQLEVQAIFLAGRNEELRADAEFLAESASFPIKVIGYSEHVEQLMGAANVMISKLGGLTTFEAFACRLPIIADGITPPMPQEAGAASLLVKRGAGVLLQRAGDIVPVIRRMVEDTAHYSAMRAATIGLAIPNATRHIVEEITALIPASTEAPEQAVLAEVVSA